MSKNPRPGQYASLSKETLETIRVMNESAKAAVAENRAYGLPEIHWIDGEVVYELLDGTMTTEVPEILRGMLDEREEK